MDKLCSFACLNDEGVQVKDTDLLGRWWVLYFYPKDMTPGCTMESKQFTELFNDFDRLGAGILGISADSVTKHACFRAKHNMPFHLLADTEKELCQGMGVWVEKSMFGKKYMGIERATFLIDPQGQVREVWRKVKVKGHAQAVLKRLLSELG